MYIYELAAVRAEESRIPARQKALDVTGNTNDTLYILCNDNFTEL